MCAFYLYSMLVVICIAGMSKGCSSKHRDLLDLVVQYTTCSSQGKEAFIKGDYQKSEEHYLEAVVIARKITNTKFYLVISLNSLAKNYQAMNDVKKAEATYLEMVSVINLTKEDVIEYKKLHEYFAELATFYIKTAQYEKGIPLIASFLSELEALNGTESQKFNDDMRFFTLLLRSAGQSDEAAKIENRFARGSTPLR